MRSCTSIRHPEAAKTNVGAGAERQRTRQSLARTREIFNMVQQSPGSVAHVAAARDFELGGGLLDVEAMYP